MLGPLQGQLLVVGGNKNNLLEKKSELGMEKSRREVFNEYMRAGFDSFILNSLFLLWPGGRKDLGFSEEEGRILKGTHKAVP